VADHALGDVRHRQVGNDSLADVLVERDALLERLDGVDDVVLVDHHALGRAGGAARVDQRGEVVGFGGGTELVEVGAAVVEQTARREHAVGQAALGWVDHVDVLQAGQLLADLEDPLEEAGVLHDGDLGFGVTEHT
jgi:hypothetical protein